MIRFVKKIALIVYAVFDKKGDDFANLSYKQCEFHAFFVISNQALTKFFGLAICVKEKKINPFLPPLHVLD